jgi:hypothetical protein
MDRNPDCGQRNPASARPREFNHDWPQRLGADRIA